MLKAAFRKFPGN